MSEPSSLYHYTNGRGLLGILDSKPTSIWATHILYLNDARELSYGVDLIRREFSSRNTHSNDEYIKKLCKLSAVLIERVSFDYVDAYVACFSEAFDDLGQWRGYAGSTDAYALTFNYQQLKSLSVSTCHAFGNCIYNVCDQERLVQDSVDVMLSNLVSMKDIVSDIDDLFESEIPAEDQYERVADRIAPELSKLVNVAIFLKDPAFESEREWRILLHGKDKVGFRLGSSLMVPYRKIHIDLAVLEELLVGPTPHPKLARKSVQMLLDSKQLSHVKVLESKVPYRTW